MVVKVNIMMILGKKGWIYTQILMVGFNDILDIGWLGRRLLYNGERQIAR